MVREVEKKKIIIWPNILRKFMFIKHLAVPCKEGTMAGP
jgi:hypothetical protein